MNIPKQLAIKDSLWNVVYKWNLMFRSQHVDGLCDYDSKTIFIDKSLSPAEKWSAFRHEYRHAVFDEFGIGFNAKDESLRLTIEQEEAIASALEIEDKHFTIKWKRKPE